MTAVSSVLPAAASTTGSSSTAINHAEIASNFTQFLQLLTTQLKNQDPLSPMDTNQFTQQLVEFSQVEQQLKTNDSLTALVSLQQTAQATQAPRRVGPTVVVDGSTPKLPSPGAPGLWNATKPANAT